MDLRDIYNVLTNKSGMGGIEVIYRNSYDSKEICIDPDTFSRMSNLRLLKIHDVLPSKGLDVLPNSLRILKWHGYPLKCLPPNFKAEKLLVLNLPHSHTEQLWKGTMHLDKLKIIKLSHSRKLTRTIDFREVPNLERLILEGCTSLYEVHASIGDLNRLVLLNLKDCRNLRRLPNNISGWKSLKVLLLLGCSKIDRLPENMGDCECLEELDVSHTSMTEAPSSILRLKNLRKLSFRGCKGQRPNFWNWFQCLLPTEKPSSVSFSLPSKLADLWSLTQLDLSDCSLSEGAIPSDLIHLSALTTLNLSRNDFVSLPESINQLSNLQTLKLEYCQRLQALPELPSSIENLSTNNCSSLATLSVPLGLGRSQYRQFSHNNCFRLVENGDENNVAISLIQNHLSLMAKIKFLSIFSMFCKFAESQGSNVPATVMLASFIRSLMNTLLQDLPDLPSVIPTLIVSLSGIGIPEWFTYQTTSSVVTVLLPPNWYNDCTFLGLAFCATFEVEGTHGQKPRNEVQHVPVIPSFIRVKCVAKYDYRLRFYLLSDEGNCVIFGKECTFSRDQFDVSNHLWLILLSFDEYFQKRTWRYVKAYFELEGSGFKFVKCGVRGMYVQDAGMQAMLQGLKPSQLGDLISQLRQSIELADQGFVIVTQKSQEPEHHCNDEAGPSGSGSCEDEETHSADMRESIDPLLERKGKRIQE